MGLPDMQIHFAASSDFEDNWGIIISSKCLLETSGEGECIFNGFRHIYQHHDYQKPQEHSKCYMFVNLRAGNTNGVVIDILILIP